MQVLAPQDPETATGNADQHAPRAALATQITDRHALTHGPHEFIRRPPLGVNAVYARLLCCSALLLSCSAAQLLSLSTVDVIVLLGAKDPDPADDHHPAHPAHRGRWYLQGKRITLGRLPLYRGYHSWPPVWLYRGYARAMSELLLW